MRQPEQDAATELLAVLSEDLLEKIGLLVCNPLRPAAASALASCSRSLHAVMRLPLEALRAWRERAEALASQVGWSMTKLRCAKTLYWDYRGLTVAHMRTLGALLGAGALPHVKALCLRWNCLGDEGVCGLCEGLGCGAAPRLVELGLYSNSIGPSGAAALGAALGRGALPKLKSLYVGYNRLGDAGLTALSTPLRRRPALELLDACANGVGGAGMLALVGGQRAGELKALKDLWLHGNPICDAGCAALVAALDGGALPALEVLNIDNVEAGAAAQKAVHAALAANVANSARRGSWLHEEGGDA